MSLSSDTHGQNVYCICIRKKVSESILAWSWNLQLKGATCEWYYKCVTICSDLIIDKCDEVTKYQASCSYHEKMSVLQSCLHDINQINIWILVNKLNITEFDTCFKNSSKIVGWIYKNWSCIILLSHTFSPKSIVKGPIHWD